MREALAELAKLPKSAPERVTLGPIPVQLRAILEKKMRPSAEEKELVLIMKDFLEETEEVGRRKGREEGREEGRVEGRKEGRVDGLRECVLRALGKRGIAMTEADRKRTLAERDADRISQWLDRAITASSIREVLGEARSASVR